LPQKYKARRFIGIITDVEPINRKGVDNPPIWGKLVLSNIMEDILVVEYDLKSHAETKVNNGYSANNPEPIEMKEESVESNQEDALHSALEYINRVQ